MNIITHKAALLIFALLALTEIVKTSVIVNSDTDWKPIGNFSVKMPHDHGAVLVPGPCCAFRQLKFLIGGSADAKVSKVIMIYENGRPQTISNSLTGIAEGGGQIIALLSYERKLCRIDVWLEGKGKLSSAVVSVLGR